MQTTSVQIDNKSKFKVTFIQIDEYAENVKVKLESEHEHKVIVNWYGKNYVQTLWMSPEKQKEIGCKVETIQFPK